MEFEVLRSIPFRPNTASLARQLRIKPGSAIYVEFQQILSQARRIAQPKAAYRAATVEQIFEEGVQIDGRRFDSRLLRAHLRPAGREPVPQVFFYLATCGLELEEWSKDMPDTLYQYWADFIKETALLNATRALQERIKTRYQLRGTSAISPGNAQEDFPISQQRLLFDVLDGLDAQLGVRLTDTFLMLPIKSVSGIRFPTDKDYESCQLCPRENCPARKAAFDHTLAGQFV